MPRAIIVDDEELSINRIKRLLAECDEIEICQTFLDPLEAYEYVKVNPVDIVFLDISMPELNGMHLSRYLKKHNDSIEIIFVTGYDEYAVEAFEVNALDYLLKPVTAQRVEITLEKIRKRFMNAKFQGSAREPEEPLLTVQMFDGLKIYRNDQKSELIKWRSPKTEELFAFLLYKKSVSREEIIDTLWGNFEPDKAWKNLNSTLYYIRKALSDNKNSTIVQASRSEIQIDINNVNCDLYIFDQLMKQARRNSNFEINVFKTAEDVYTGPLLRGKMYEWASNKVFELENDYMELMEQAARYYMKENQIFKSLYYFEEILKLNWLREDISHEIIRLYIEIGKYKEAVHCYRKLEDVCRNELGTEPAQSTQNLVQSIV